MPCYQIITFGCKVNQYDSAVLAEVLAREGFAARPPGEPPDLVVVNTCTVTARADREARQVLRRLARTYPGVPLWVTGCYAQRAPEELAALPGVAGILGHREKFSLTAFLAAKRPGDGPFIEVHPLGPGEIFPNCGLPRFAGHTRAWLKVQDGCSHGCSYCIVPLVRGRGRSLSPQEVAQSLNSLAARGYQEVVLTGVDLGQYGQDLSPPVSLARLLGTLAQGPRLPRLRLSSLEPQGVNQELLEALSTFPRLCPHFHLPLQSGSEAVLKAMGRPYRPEHFRELCLALTRRFPEAALGLDVLVGFTGEGPSDFEATYKLVASLPVAYLHVFPFSPRPGTPAHHLKPLAPAEVRQRAQVMRELGQNLKARFYLNHLGRTGEVLVEGPAPGRPGWLRALSANYLRVLLPGPPDWRNRLLPVRYTRMQGGYLVAEAL